MPIIVKCTGCEAKLKAPDRCAGQRVKCPKCGGVIQVPAAEEKPIELEENVKEETPPKTATVRRRSTDTADAEEQPSRKGQRRQHDEEDEEPPRRSRLRQEDDKDDEDDDDGDQDLPRRRQPAAGLQHGIGIASLSLAVLVLLIVWIPALRPVVWPMCGVAFVLGLVGLCIAIAKGTGHGFPIAGCEVSGIACVASFLWIVILPDVAKSVGERLQQNQDMAKEAARQLPGQAQNGGPLDNQAPPGGTAPARALTLTNGLADVNDALAAGDPRDSLQQECYCKVYTLNMSAGRTYQIDMISAALDSYLRLENPDGQNIAEDDDGGEGLNARIVFTCNRDGPYRIVATSLDTRIGAFNLRVQER